MVIKMDNIQNIFKRWQFYSYPQMYQIPKCKHVLREKYSDRPPFSNMPYLTKPGPGLSLSPTNMQNFALSWGSHGMYALSSKSLMP